LLKHAKAAFAKFGYSSLLKAKGKRVGGCFLASAAVQALLQ